MLIPSLQYLKKANPKREKQQIAATSACAEILQGNPCLTSITVYKESHLKSLSGIRLLGQSLASMKPDAVLLASGLKPETGSLVSFLSHALNRVGEDWRGRGFLYTKSTDVDSRIAEFERNLRIAKLLEEAPIAVNSDPRLFLREDEIQAARDWLGINGCAGADCLLGIHPGSGAGQEWKRWGIDRFIQVAEMLSRLKVQILFIIGPEEADLTSRLERVRGKTFLIFCNRDSIRKTAAMIQCCNYFISNDSGLHQIALALDIPSLGIFGPTSIEKNSPGGDRHIAYCDETVKCRPCHYTHWFLACGPSHPCLDRISPEQIIQVVMQDLQKGHFQ